MPILTNQYQYDDQNSNYHSKKTRKKIKSIRPRWRMLIFEASGGGMGLMEPYEPHGVTCLNRPIAIPCLAETLVHHGGCPPMTT